MTAVCGLTQLPAQDTRVSKCRAKFAPPGNSVRYLASVSSNPASRTASMRAHDWLILSTNHAKSTPLERCWSSKQSLWLGAAWDSSLCDYKENLHEPSSATLLEYIVNIQRASEQWTWSPCGFSWSMLVSLLLVASMYSARSDLCAWCSHTGSSSQYEIRRVAYRFKHSNHSSCLWPGRCLREALCKHQLMMSSLSAIQARILRFAARVQ